jgi:hypothetical protein
MGTRTATTTTVRRLVDPDDLICPGCGDRAIGVPPAFWQVRDGLPVAQFSHPHRTRCAALAPGRWPSRWRWPGDRAGP